MIRINIITPELDDKRFSGGIWCIMQYANLLAKKGHDVRVIPMLPSKVPLWVDISFKYITEDIDKYKHFRGKFNSFYMSYLFEHLSKQEKKARVNEAINRYLFSKRRRLSILKLKAMSIDYVSNIIPEADVTIATSYETALPVCLFGKGIKMYFIQHYEPYFKNEYPEPEMAEIEAKLSYNLGLSIVANSSWLKNKIETELNISPVDLCLNAINQDIFYGEPIDIKKSTEIKVISYGGRNAQWKGFREMAQAVQIARKACPDINLKWHVYGDALLPPNNDIAPYDSLGFLKPLDLANSYRQSDLLLSASWYESFPLFPLEAMACGLPVLTTQFGTEDYAFHEETAEIVEARNPNNIAKGLIKLIKNPDYRRKLAIEGNKVSKEFSWEKSANTMENIIKCKIRQQKDLEK